MKKKLSFILAAVITVCNLAISVMAAETTKVKLTDVTDTTKYAEEILTLVELGIINGYEDSTFRADAEISRAEFTKIIAASMGASDKTNGTTTLTDITNHWAKPYVIAAQANDIINGFEDNTFRPDDKVTYEQAVKMLVCALRYNKTALGYGGWPNGYITTGNEIGVCDNVVVDSNAASLPTTRGVVAKLVYNALEVDLADIETGNATDQTFMNFFLKKGRVKGTVVGIADNLTDGCDESISLYEIAIKDKKTGKLVVIDYTTLYADKVELINYLGQDVVAYYDIPARGGAKTLAVFGADTNNNEITEVFSNDIISYSSGKLKYYDDEGKSVSVDFDADDATVLYNKKIVSSGVESKLANWLDPNSSDFYYGTVTFTDTGSNNSIDVIEIMDYYPVMASRVPSKSDYKLTNKIKFNASVTPVEEPVSSVVLDPDKVSYLNITDEKGTKLQPTGIKTNSIALVAESLDSDAYTVLVSTKTVKGEINYYSETERIISVKNQKYLLSNMCIDYVENHLGMDFKNGQEGTFYLDAFGTIMFADLSATTENSTYAYIISAISDDSESSASLRVYIPSKGYGTYDLADKVRLDGRTETAESVCETLQENKLSFKADETAELYKDNQGNVESITESNAYQLAILEIDGNIVKEIITISDSDNRLERSLALEKVKYTSSINFSNKVYMNSDTKIIFVPQNRRDSNKYRKPILEAGKQYYIEAYNVDSSKYADVILVYGSSSDLAEITYKTPISVVAENPYLDGTGEENVTKMPTYNDSATFADVTIGEDATAAKSFKTGDIIRYVLDDYSEVVNAELMLSYADIKGVLDAQTERLSDGDIIYAWPSADFSYKNNDYNLSEGIPHTEISMYNLKSIGDDGSIIVTSDGFVFNAETNKFELSDANTILYDAKSAKILMYDSGERKITNVYPETEDKLTIDDLQEADIYLEECSKIAVIRRGSSAVKMIVIYR